MKQKKQTHHSKPHANDYAAKQRAIRQAYIQATCDTYSQYVFDCACIVLHREFGFGRERMMKFHAALSKLQTEFTPALDSGDESGYMQEVMDRTLREVFGDDLKPFERRYEWLKEIV